MGKLGPFLPKKIFKIKGRLCTTFKKTNIQKHWKKIERAHKVGNSRENRQSSMLTKSAPNMANKLNRVQLLKVCRWLDQHQIVPVQQTKWWVQGRKIPQFPQPFRSDQTRKLFHHTKDKLFLTVWRPQSKTLFTNRPILLHLLALPKLKLLTRRDSRAPKQTAVLLDAKWANQ